MLTTILLITGLLILLEVGNQALIKKVFGICLKIWIVLAILTLAFSLGSCVILTLI